jgi:hypothetical protein
VVYALDFVLPREREAAGAEMASGELRVRVSVGVWVHKNAGGEFQEVCQIKENRIGEEGGARAHQSCRDRADTSADAVDSGEESPQPGGELSEGKEGESKRGSWAIYRHGAGKKRQGN